MPRVVSNEEITLPALEPTLYGMTNESLERYAAILPGKTLKRKADLVAKIYDALTNPDEVRRLLGTMSEDQRLALAFVAHSLGGKYDKGVVEARYPQVKTPLGADSTYYFYSGRRREAQAFDLFVYSTWQAGSFIPPDLAALLRSLLPPPPPMRLRARETPPQYRRRGEPIETFISSGERAALHDLAATLDFVQQGKAAISATTRLPTLPTVRQLRERLLAGDYFPEPDYARAEDAIRPTALIMIVQAAKWAAPNAAGGKLELTRQGQALIGGAMQPRHAREAWERWLKSDVLDELSRVKGIKGQQSKRVRLTKPTSRREKLTATLRVLPPDRWVEFRDLLRYMRAENNLPHIERNEELGLHTGDYSGYYSPWDSGELDYVDVVIGSYLRAVLWEYVATLGLIEIAYTRPEDTPDEIDPSGYSGEPVSRYDGLLAIRLTPLGAYALGLTGDYTPSAPEPQQPVLRLLPNLDVVVVDAARIMPNDRSFLQRIAAQQSQDVYRLTRDSLLDAAESGLAIDQVRGFLSARSGLAEDDFPQTLRVFFSDLERRLNAVRDAGHVLVLESDDPYLLTELANEPVLRNNAQLAKIEDRLVLLLPAEAEAAARRQLKKLGYIPRKSDA